MNRNEKRPQRRNSSKLEMAGMPAGWRSARGCFIRKVRILGEVIRPEERVLKKNSRLLAVMARNLRRSF